MKLRLGLTLMLVAMVSFAMSCLAGPAAGVITFGAAFMERPTGAFFAGVTPEIWQKDIVENLFKNNEFMLQSIDESQYVLGGSVVHIPQAGAASKATRNRQQLPATITNRKDTDVTYALDEITTDPRFISDADKAELSYDKRMSCIADDLQAIQEIAANAMLYRWAPTFFMKTSGSSKAAHYGTGTRKAPTIADFKTAKKIFNKWNIAKGDRFVILDSDMISQLTDELLATTSRDTMAVYDPVSGELRGLEGFKIYERSTVLLASAQTLTAVANSEYFKWTSDTSKLYTIEEFAEIEAGEKSAATTSAAVALFWSKTAVSRALGNTKMFDNPGSATMYGDIYSFLQRIGGRARRGDGKGVLGLIQVA